jgi:glycine/D-amino acid oxidase-like deaminating enzyme
MLQHERYDAVIVGGGFFGCSLAAWLRKRHQRVLLLERDNDYLQRASYANQARVHNGYHYPRHFLTAVRSRVNFPRFIKDYESCIHSSFEKYYAVGKRFSKTTAQQFRNFMQRAGLPIEPAGSAVTDLFNPDLIEAVFKVREVAFDAVKLKVAALERMSAAGVEHYCQIQAGPVRRDESSALLRLALRGAGLDMEVAADRIFNCTYSQINELLLKSALPIIPLKHEITEMALVELPDELKDISVTVMCGPFFSFMPFPPRGLHTLSHVRYTPHCHWYDQAADYISPYERFAQYTRKTNFPAMIRDCQRYLPALAGARQQDSIWEVKTTLPASETDDGRPILFRPDHGLPGLTCIMGGKIDNIYDVQDEIEKCEARLR